ncbi:MAG: hypothetical protein ABGW69_01075 [Nanoarchaeota archaeon]
MFIFNIGKNYFDSFEENTKENSFINYLKEIIENCDNVECNFIKNNFDFINWKEEEELLEHKKEYNLVLLPFENNKLLNLHFVKFLITSNLKEEVIACLGFTNFGVYFYKDISDNFETNLKVRENNYFLIERKKREWDEDYEIKSKLFIANRVNEKIFNKNIIFLEMPNYSFLLSYFSNNLFLGIEYNLNDIEELYFANFFVDDNKKLKIEKLDFGEVIWLNKE